MVKSLYMYHYTQNLKIQHKLSLINLLHWLRNLLLTTYIIYATSLSKMIFYVQIILLENKIN